MAITILPIPGNSAEIVQVWSVALHKTSYIFGLMSEISLSVCTWNYSFVRYIIAKQLDNYS